MVKQHELSMLIVTTLACSGCGDVARSTDHTSSVPVTVHVPTPTRVPTVPLTPEPLRSERPMSIKCDHSNPNYPVGIGGYTLPSDYRPPDLIDVPAQYATNSAELQLKEVAWVALKPALDELASRGMRVTINSAYRSHSEQAQLIRTMLDDIAAKNRNLSPAMQTQMVLNQAAPPGGSEHQTGLAADLQFVQSIAPLVQEIMNAYGFIATQVGTNGRKAESWHYTYRGREFISEFKRAKETNPRLTIEQFTLEYYARQCKVSDLNTHFPIKGGVWSWGSA